ncbi:hypothetical protein [Agrococcus citreus]|uniref:Uncharacterized protein n=1 Tax=Agrococcus citreus TaxID=84643 RepID=A0ABN1YQX8_9MICO
MTSTPIDSQLDALRTKGSTLIAGYKQHIAEIQNDESRSAQWKREQSDDAYNAAQAELRELLTKEEKAIDDAIAHRTRTLTGSHKPLTGHDAIAARDAEDRVTGITDSSKALDMMQRAINSNDPSLAQALLTRSLQYGFAEAVSAYSSAYPATGTTLNEIEALSRHKSLNADMARQFFYGAISPAR